MARAQNSSLVRINVRGVVQGVGFRPFIYQLADRHNLAVTAGSDSHTLREIGHTYVEMPDFSGKDDFLEALRQGRISRRRSSLLVHFGSFRAKLKRLF